MMSFRHIIRVVSTDLDGNLLIPHALSKIKGVSLRYAEILTKLANIDISQRLGFLADRDIKKLEDLLKATPEENKLPAFLVNRQKDIKSGQNDHLIGSRLILVQKDDIDRMKRTRSVKGIRHQLGLKVRGQHTKTTGRRGSIVGVHRKKVQQQQEKK
jgi:small subunit ribosomal protein S13